MKSTLAKLIQTKLKSKGQNIKVTELAGPSITRSLQKSNHDPPVNCGRPECAMCLNENSNFKCYKPKIGYRFVCNMPPCNSSINMKKISTSQLLNQLSTKQPTHPPAIYEGQSHRSSYSRNLGHFSKYKAKSKSSWMWRHNLSHHGGVIKNYKTDFKYTLLNNHKHLISKHCNEGWRQSKMEELQQAGKVLVLNSKLDFTRPFMRHLTMQTGSANTGPGQQQPHMSRPVPSGRQLPAAVRQPNRVIPLKTKPKIRRCSAQPLKRKTTTSDSFQMNQTQTGRQIIQSDTQSKSILISCSKDVVSSTAQPSSPSIQVSCSESVELSTAQPSRPRKRRSSTPVHILDTKKIKFDIITLSPIKEPNDG